MLTVNADRLLSALVLLLTPHLLTTDLAVNISASGSTAYAAECGTPDDHVVGTPTPTPTCSCPAQSPEAGSGLKSVAVDLAPGAELSGPSGELQIEAQLRMADDSRLTVLRVPADRVADVLSELRKVPGVRQAERAFNLSPSSGESTPNDIGKQRYLHDPTPAISACADADHDINAPQAWEALGYPSTDLGGLKVAIGMVDTGGGPHPEIDDRLDPTNRRNFGSLMPNSNVTDDHGHGTHVAAVIAAQGNNGGVAGVMWGTRIVPCKFVGVTKSSVAITACLRWLAELVDQGHPIVVINLSFEDPQCSCAIESALRGLRDRGVLIVAAAGNRGVDNDGASAGYPASLPLSNIISVGSNDDCSKPSSSNNFGKRSVHLSSPVGMPQIVGGDLGVFQSTSCAAAVTTGVIALLKAAEQRPVGSLTPTPKPRDWRALRSLVIAGGIRRSTLEGKTISERALRAWDAPTAGESTSAGSLTCSDQIVRRRIWPRQDTVPAPLDDPLLVRVLSINCANPLNPGNVSVALNGVPIGSLALRDDGQSPDDFGGDGEWAGTWPVPTDPGTYSLGFWSDPGETLQVDR